MTSLLKQISLPAEGLWAFRRGLALLCLYDALERLTHASFFYSDLGLFPRNAYYLDPNHLSGFNLYLLSGQPLFVVSLLVLTGGVAGFQLFGRSTPWRRGLLWLLVCSIQFRFSGLMDSSDDLLRLMLFWDIFLPESEAGSQSDCVSWATIGLQIQLCAALLGIARHQSERQWALAAQWGGTQWAEALPGFSRIEVFAYLLLAIAVWWGKPREVVVILALPILVFRATVMHPLFPLTLVVGLLPLIRWRRRSTGTTAPKVRGENNGLWLPPQQATLGVLVGNLMRAPVFWFGLLSFSQGFGFSGDWDRVYPLAAPATLQLAVRSSAEPRPLFQLGTSDGRRKRLLSDALARNLGLATSLSAAVQRKRGATGISADTWVKIDLNRPDFRLGFQTIRMVTPTTTQPVLEPGAKGQ